jgi:GNAT superfamily N-acetyltransferase
MAGVDDAGALIAIRPAQMAETGALDVLIERSAEELSRGFYTPAQRLAAITHVFGVDRQLVLDGTYFTVLVNGQLAACGGWSRRETLFGGDQYADRSARLLDPASEAARIRAFFVDPAFARRGLASRLLATCEQAAGAEGFTALELMATLPGVPFYASRGFEHKEDITVALDGADVPFVAMRKVLDGSADHRTSGTGGSGIASRG